MTSSGGPPNNLVHSLTFCLPVIADWRTGLQFSGTVVSISCSAVDFWVSLSVDVDFGCSSEESAIVMLCYVCGSDL